MACETGCIDETVQQDDFSPGPVENREVVCRGAYGRKMHYHPTTGKIRHTFIRNNDLLNGSLSVWRRFSGSNEEFQAITEILSEKSPEDNHLYDVFGAAAGTIRAIRVTAAPEKQVLHVYDDCLIDNAGGKHRNHASLAICESFDPGSMEKDSVIFMEIRDELFKLLVQGRLWALPDEQRS